jgi:hypothetical protein
MVVGKPVQKRSGLFLGLHGSAARCLGTPGSTLLKNAYVFSGLGADKPG